MENQQPEATQAAIKQLQADFNSHAETAAKELRRLHARNQELEAMLDAVGAGGVSAQRITQGKDHIAQPLEMVAAPVVLPEPEAYLFQHEDTGQTMFVEAQQVEWGFEANNPRLQKISCVYTEEQVRELLDKATCTKSQTAQEPFGYFKAEPFGWRDCAEADEGAIALYEAPQPQADAQDAELVAAVVYASTEAMNSSMESPSFDGSIILESHHAASLSLALDELEQHRAAIAAAKGE